MTLPLFYKAVSMTDKKKLIILGLGNIITKDEGFGVHFLRWFLERHRLPEEVEAVDGGTLGYVLLGLFDRCERMIVIDTIKLPDPPGSIYRFTHEEMSTYLPPPTTAHEVSFPRPVQGRDDSDLRKSFFCASSLISGGTWG